MSRATFHGVVLRLTVFGECMKGSRCFSKARHQRVSSWLLLVGGERTARVPASA